ncbi:uncharacterized protein LOC141535359 [Cotesia typhae]|uniref:uncharacterized protein LOC141535359 n=1 Tax=Cotesia typhae TaxID=2053667 RepID=UPI003D6881D5
MAQDNSKMRIAQWNCRGLRNKSHLIPCISTCNDILILSETWLTNDTKYGISKMNLIRKDREFRTGGGVAIAIRKGLPYEEITLDHPIFNDEDIEIVVAKITLLNKKLTITSIYIPPNIQINLVRWKTLLKELLNISKDDPIIIGGDFNTHNESWGSTGTSASGINLATALEDLELFVINNGNHTYINHNHGNNALDLTIVNKTLKANYTWETTNSTLNSDHIVIQITMTNAPEAIKQTRPQIRTNKVDWEKFKEK